MNSSLALHCNGVGDPLRISALPRPGGRLTIEAWIRPEDASTPRCVLLFGRDAWQLALLAGGGQGKLTLELVIGTNRMALCSVANALKAGTWSHIAVTIQPINTGGFGVGGFTVKLLHQGKQRASQSIKIGPQALGLHSLLKGALPDCYLGRGVAAVPGFLGEIAELRAWKSALPEATIASRWRQRARGDEDGLLACYRLERGEGGLLEDISAHRGFGALTSAHSWVSRGDLPLAASDDPEDVRLRAEGKLVREHLAIPVKKPDGGIVTVRPSSTPGLPGLPSTPNPSTPNPKIPEEKVEWTVRSVFDATVRARAPDASALAGTKLEVRLDAAMTAILDEGETTRFVEWPANTSHFVPLSPTGQARLRFVARGLTCPTLRVRHPGMPNDLWTVVRPDQAAHRRLQSVTAADLRAPADGRASPLPPSATPEDAEALAQALTTLTRALPPGPSNEQTRAKRIRTATQLAGVSRLSWGDIADAAGDVVDGAEDLAEDTYDGATDLYDATTSLGSDVVDGVGDAVQGATKTVVATSEDAVQGAKRAVKGASQLVTSAGAELDALVAAARTAPAQVGERAIRTFIDTADTLAVWTQSAAGEIVRTFEIIGTSIVDGATVVWRVVCAGVLDAITAIEELVKRIGAKIAAFIEYLLFLFNWQDFLDASDDAYKYFDKTLSELPTRLGAVIQPLKQQIRGTLSSALDDGFAQKSIAQTCGINIDADTPGIDELNYLFEQVSRVMDSAQEAVGKGIAAAAAEVDAAAAQQASGLMNLVPFDRFSSPVALLTAPLGELLSDAAELGDGSGSLVDSMFASMESTMDAALTGGAALLKRRLYVPYVTSMIEDIVLGGRTLNLLRVAALYAAILKVLADKTSGRAHKSSGAQFASKIAGLNKQSLPDEPAPETGQQTPAWHIWGPTACGFVNSLCLAVQTGLELAYLKKDKPEAVRWWIGFLSYTSAVALAAASVFNLAGADRMPKRTKEYVLTLCAFEATTGLWLAVSGYIRKELKDSPSREAKEAQLDKIDTVGLSILALGSLITAIIPMAKRLPKGDREWTTYSLRAATATMTGVTRAWSMYDNSDTQGGKKYATLGMLVIGAVVDLSAASYEYSQSLKQT
jgi:hypothetical protein